MDAQTPAQGAGLVHFYGNPVQIVDIGEQFGSGMPISLKPRFPWKHPLVEHAGDTDPIGHNAIKHNMFLMFEPAQALTYRVAGTTDPWIPGETPKAPP